MKACQIVQTNWKPSPQWEYRNKEKIADFMAKTDEHFKSNLEYDIYKSSSTEQLIRQAEVDVLGISMGSGSSTIYSI